MKKTASAGMLLLTLLCLSGCANYTDSGNLPTDTLPSAVSSENFTETLSPVTTVTATSVFSEKKMSEPVTTTTVPTDVTSPKPSGTTSIFAYDDTETVTSVTTAGTTAAVTSQTTVPTAAAVPQTTVSPASAADVSSAETEPPETSVKKSPETVPVSTAAADTVTHRSSESQDTEISPDEVSPEETSSKKIKYVTYQEYFENSLFVGDSICSGLKIYGGLLNTENVAARLNVSTWGIDKYTFQYKTNSTAELDAFSIASLYQPEDIYIWMGMNDLYVVSEEKFGQNLCDLADRFHAVSPESRIHIVSVTPMSANHKWNRELDGNNKVNIYNSAAESACAEKDDLDWINIHDSLIDESGCLASDYNGGDGLHLSANAYKVVLNCIIDHNENQ